MSDLEQWSLIVGLLIPMLIAVIQQPSFSKPLRAIVTVLVCLVVGIVTVALQGELDWSRWGHAVLLILVAAWTAYGRFWKPTGIAKTIEDATSPRRKQVAPSTQ